MNRIWNRFILHAEVIQSTQFLHNCKPKVVLIQSTRSASHRTLSHNERKLVRIPPNLMYETVKDVDNYVNFVPYCISSVVTSETESHSRAKLSVGFGPITENYTSALRFEKPLYVEALCSDGKLFNSLNCMWKFKPVKSPDMCIIDFHVDFEFKSSFYSKIANIFFNEVVKTMVTAFEKEAKRQLTRKRLKKGL